MMDLTRNLALRITALAAAFFLLAEVAQAAAAHSRDDFAPALRIGAHTTSQYVVDKYFNRFVTGEQQRLGHAPPPEIPRAWLELFLAKQVIIAHAKSLGYASRPEVRDIVDRMERHMLTQSEGPFYQKLFPPAAPSAARVREHQARRALLFDLSLVRFDDDAAATAGLGADFAEQSTEEKLQRIEAAGQANTALVIHGRMPWPLYPFVELTAALADATAGQWFTYSAPGLGRYYGYVRDVIKPSQPGPDVAHAQLEAEVSRWDREHAQRHRRGELLAAAKFRCDRELAAHVLDRIRTLPAGTPEIPVECLESVAALPLATYEIEAHTVTISPEDFRQHFNTRFIRRLPADVEQLRINTEDMVVEELDFRAARAAGVHEEPQFAEDRRGFTDMQVLDFFEKEVLFPEIHIEHGEIERYYHEKASEFSRVTHVGGKMLQFASKEELTAWQQNRAASTPAENDDELSLADLPAEFAPWRDMIPHLPAGMPLGPVQRGDLWLVFLRGDKTRSERLPLAEAAPAIRERLQRARLEEKERALAFELGRELEVRDDLDYARWGFTAATVRTPWRQ